MENGCSYSYSIFHFSFSMENENNGMYTDREPTGLFPVLVGLLILSRAGINLSSYKKGVKSPKYTPKFNNAS